MPDSSANNSKYSAAFGSTSACPTNPCTGYKLTQDISLSDSAYDNWQPIELDHPLTTGLVLDGQGHKITHLRNDVQNSGTQTAGLFKVLDENHVIKNLHLEKVKLSGWTVGAFTGHNGGLIVDSSATGTITCGIECGGLAGFNQGGTIARSFFVGKIENRKNIGGLVGFISPGRIIHSYAVVDFPETSSPDRQGALISNGNRAQITASYAVVSESISGLVADTYPGGKKPLVNVSYWDSVVSKDSGDDSGGLPRTSADLKLPENYSGAYGDWQDGMINTTIALPADFGGSPDDPWDFGDDTQYPALKGNALSVSDQRGLYTSTGGVLSVKAAKLGAVGMSAGGWKIVEGGAGFIGADKYTAAVVAPDNPEGQSVNGQSIGAGSLSSFGAFLTQTQSSSEEPDDLLTFVKMYGGTLVMKADAGQEGTVTVAVTGTSDAGGSLTVNVPVTVSTSDEPLPAFAPQLMAGIDDIELASGSSIEIDMTDHFIGDNLSYQIPSISGWYQGKRGWWGPGSKAVTDRLTIS